MRTIEDIEWEAPPLVGPHRDREVERVIRRKFGIVRSSYRYLKAVPWLASEEQFLELVGVTALANVVCRLAVVLDET